MRPGFASIIWRTTAYSTDPGAICLLSRLIIPLVFGTGAAAGGSSVTWSRFVWLASPQRVRTPQKLNQDRFIAVTKDHVRLDDMALASNSAMVRFTLNSQRRVAAERHIGHDLIRGRRVFALVVVEL